MSGDQAYVAKLRDRMGQCRTTAQYRSLFERAGVSGVIDDRCTPTSVCVDIQRICRETRERLENPQ